MTAANSKFIATYSALRNDTATLAFALAGKALGGNHVFALRRGVRNRAATLTFALAGKALGGQHVLASLWAMCDSATTLTLALSRKTFGSDDVIALGRTIAWGREAICMRHEVDLSLNNLQDAWNAPKNEWNASVAPLPV